MKRTLPALDDPRLAKVAGKRVLIATSTVDCDPTEVAVVWQQLVRRDVDVSFAMPDGRVPSCDARMITGDGLGLWKGVLRADARGRAAWDELVVRGGAAKPVDFTALRADAFDAVVLPGGHAPGMRPYLESTELATFVAAFAATGRPLAAICHGVIVAARARADDGTSVLRSRRTTSLLRRQERLAWQLTRRRLGDYYRTYPTWVQDEVTAALADPEQFVVGNSGLWRDRPENLSAGFVVRDGNYLSARWPGDAHRFAAELLEMLAEG